MTAATSPRTGGHRPAAGCAPVAGGGSSADEIRERHTDRVSDTEQRVDGHVPSASLNLHDGWPVDADSQGDGLLREVRVEASVADTDANGPAAGEERVGRWSGRHPPTLHCPRSKVCRSKPTLCDLAQGLCGVREERLRGVCSGATGLCHPLPARPHPAKPRRGQEGDDNWCTCVRRNTSSFALTRSEQAAPPPYRGGAVYVCTNDPRRSSRRGPPPRGPGLPARTPQGDDEPVSGARGESRRPRPAGNSKARVPTLHSPIRVIHTP